MNHFEFVLGIILIVMVAGVLRARYGAGRRRGSAEDEPPAPSAETLRLREEVKALRDRMAVLERITIEKESSLEREIEQLRDR